MKMLARLNYLFSEGFEVASLSGYDDNSGEGNAKILFLNREASGSCRLCSEVFDVSQEEMELCSSLFLKHLSRNAE